MVDATSTQPLFSSGAATSATPASNNTANEKLSSDFDTFLRMLTVQVQNQDPLNPVDATDYATQLATFSSVEQQVLTNDLLREMGAAMASNPLESLSAWVGMEALVEAPAYFYGAPVSIRPDFAPGADSANLVVYNAVGDEVQEFALDVTAEDVIWGGSDGVGGTLPAGVYSFEIKSYSGTDLLQTSTPQIYSEILEVRQEPDGAVLRMSDGTELSPSEVTGLRRFYGSTVTAPASP